MAITVKHNKVSTVPDGDDTSVVRPSDWNADHTLVGTIDVPNGGTGASTLTGYVKGNGTSAMTASATVPSTDITGLGTMSTQNANAVAITGGTINNTTIGATTPASIVGTTITGQTANITGIGQNFLLHSNTFTNGIWALTNTTVATTVATTDPLGGSNAYKLTDNVTNATHAIQQNSFTAVLGQEYVTSSIYVKSAEYSQFQIDMSDAATGNVSCIFNLSTATAGAISTSGSWTNGTTSITNIGNGWYRCALSASKGGGAGNAIAIYRIASAGSVSFAGTGTSGIYIYGSQLEAANSVGVPVITTSAVVFNAPALQLAGNTVLRLDQFGNLSVSPSFPSGAIQAQATTSTAAGGNVRGANAVDWQTSRNAATQVASGQYATISGGYRGTASGFASSLVGGESNTSSGFVSTVVGGSTVVASGQYSFAGGGYALTISGNNSVGIGGYGNTASGFYNLIGGGYTNSGTSGSAVTTQSGTMNGTTAVTLSGSNASIKVGQLISGTSITTFPHTYVAAISGTSLTLSQAASGSSTSTLSFFTPHGIVVGGGNNQATGSYSFIGGGGDAGTAGNRNVASGDWSVVGGGRGNVASGLGSVVCGGGMDATTTYANTASGLVSVVSGGLGHTSSANGSVVIGGFFNTANAAMSSILGGRSATTRGIEGNTVIGGCNVPISGGSAGFHQSAILVLARQTTDATATVLTSNSSAASTTNQVILPNNSAYYFRGEIVSGVTGGGNTKGFFIEGVIKRGANAASTALVGTPTVTSNYADAGASAWAIAVTADTTNGGLRVTFTGQAATTIRTVAQIRTTEMTF